MSPVRVCCGGGVQPGQWLLNGRPRPGSPTNPSRQPLFGLQIIAHRASVPDTVANSSIEAAFCAIRCACVANSSSRNPTCRRCCLPGCGQKPLPGIIGPHFSQIPARFGVNPAGVASDGSNRGSRITSPPAPLGVPGTDHTVSGRSRALMPEATPDTGPASRRSFFCPVAGAASYRRHNDLDRRFRSDHRRAEDPARGSVLVHHLQQDGTAAPGG